MALWNCGGCGTAYSVGAPQCPQCGSTDWTEDEVPKISSTGVATGGVHVPPEPTAQALEPLTPVTGAETPGAEAIQPPADDAPAGDAAALEAPEPPGEAAADAPEAAAEETLAPEQAAKPAKPPKAPVPPPPAKAPDG